MTDFDNDLESNRKSPAKDRFLLARRNFLAGSLAAPPIISSLASRPAWAGCQTVSVSVSMAASRDVGQTCQGMDPSYWRTSPDMVGQYVAHVGPANPIDYYNLIDIPTDYNYPTESQLQAALPGHDDLHARHLKEYIDWLKLYGSSRPSPPFGTKFNDIFGPYADIDLTLMQALWLDDVQLVCQSACAWLNANEYPGTFGYTPDEVVGHFRITGMADPDHLTEVFAAMNTASYSP